MVDLVLLLCWFLTTVGLSIIVGIVECKIIDLEFKLKEIEKNENKKRN